MSSTNPQPDPLSSLVRRMKGRVRTLEEEAALLAKIKAGTATPEEIEKYENRPVRHLAFGGMVEVTTAPPMTLEQWIAATPHINAAEQERREREREKSKDDPSR